LPPGSPCGGVGAKATKRPRATSWRRGRRNGASQGVQRTHRAAHGRLQQQIEEKAKPYREKFLAEKNVKEAKLADLEWPTSRSKKRRPALDEEIAKERKRLKPLPMVRALFDLGPDPPPTRILIRGMQRVRRAGSARRAVHYEREHARLSHPAAAALFGPAAGSRPLAHSSRTSAHGAGDGEPDLAASFRTGLVASPGNFGRMGVAPVNQRLLDWLAVEFVESGWDIKAMTGSS